MLTLTHDEKLRQLARESSARLQSPCNAANNTHNSCYNNKQLPWHADDYYLFHHAPKAYADSSAMYCGGCNMSMQGGEPGGRGKRAVASVSAKNVNATLKTIVRERSVQ